MLLFLEKIENDKDRDNIILLYECYHRQLYYLAYSWIKDSAIAEDLVQETYMAVIKYLENIEEKSFYELKKYQKARKKNQGLKVSDFVGKKKNAQCLRTWNYLATILKHKYVDWLGVQKRQIWDSLEEVMDEGIIESPYYLEGEYLKLEEKKVLNQSLLELPEPYKSTLTLYYYNELSAEEIGKVLKKTGDNVRQILVRGRHRLKEKMKERSCYGE